MIHFYMTVGIPASGKSTWARENASRFNFEIVSSDEVRMEMFGDNNIQGDPNIVFQNVHERILNFLKSGKSVIFDATNLNYKHRMVILERVGKIADVKKHAYVFATSYERCWGRNELRENSVPDYVIKRMRESFTMPQWYEGWDTIEVVYDKDYMRGYGSLLEIMNTFSQENVNHKMTLGHHITKVADGVATITGDENLYWAAKLHDIGKLYTKKFENAKGEYSESAHFYNHENVSAYEAMFYIPFINRHLSVRGCDVVTVCGYIQNHMRLQQAKSSDKAKDKLRKLVGDDYYRMLEILYVADCNAKE